MARQLPRRGSHYARVVCLVSSTGFWPQLFGRVPSLHDVCGEGWHRLATSCFDPAVRAFPREFLTQGPHSFLDSAAFLVCFLMLQ